MIEEMCLRKNFLNTLGIPKRPHTTTHKIFSWFEPRNHPEASDKLITAGLNSTVGRKFDTLKCAYHKKYKVYPLVPNLQNLELNFKS